MRRAAASRRPRGLRCARLWWPAFSPSFLHTPKVTTVLLSFSYGEWNFGLLFVSLGRGGGAGRGGVVFLSSINLRGHFRLHGRCWRSFMNDWSVHEDHGTRGTGRARVGARSSNFEGRGTALETAEQQPREGTRGRGAAPTNTNESQQHRAAAGAHARAHTPTGEWSACSSGAPQRHERGQRSTLSKRTLTRWRRS